MCALVIPCEVLSPGITEGELSVLQSFAEPYHSDSIYHLVDPETEVEHFHQQVASLAESLRTIVARLESESLSAEADIVRAHLMMLGDRKFHGRIEDLVRRTGLAAHAAVASVVEEMLAIFSTMKDPVLAERASDLKDLATQLEDRLRRQETHDLARLLAHKSQPVLAIHELLPSIVLQGRGRVRALVVERGTGFSHGAILARAFGIPALRVAGLEALQASEGARVLVDGRRGELLIEPDASDRRERMEVDTAVGEPIRCRTIAARLWVSIVDPSELEGFDWRQIEGVGLYRTETLFMAHREDFPGEQEQVQIYRRLFELCGSRPVTVRTADLGGDKPVSYLSASHEDNPYLGLRAHRVCRYLPELLITQVRAILRAAHGDHALRILYPMVECMDQWHFIQRLVDEAVRSLRAEGRPFQERFQQGVLVETPSAVWEFRRFLKHVDFAAIGTNDLVQYVFAVERNNINVADLYQPEHPIVLRLLRQMVCQARQAGKDLSLCGEVARNTRLLPLLVGLGLRDLTVGTRSVPSVAERLCTLEPAECRRMARRSLHAESIEQVRQCLGGIPERGGQKVSRGQAVDPVCSMAVRKVGNPYSIARDGVTYYFCSARCLARFRNQDPQGPVAGREPKTAPAGRPTEQQGPMTGPTGSG